ncbi:MAG: hypothetical protein WC947_00350 [Elusimicrobiota bacterium]
MKKCAVVFLTAVMVGVGFMAAYAAGDVTPVKVSLVPTVGIPSQETVHGLNLGLIGDNVKEVQGLQLSWIYSGTKEKMVGLQAGFVDIGKEVTGVQYGFYNQADNMTGLQLGFINSTEYMNGVQIGLVNIIKKGALPFMVLVNANF